MTSRIPQRNWMIVLLALIACASADFHPLRAATKEDSPSRLIAKPYLLHLNGIGGYMWIDRNMLAGLNDGGVEADVDHYDWTLNDPGLHALVALQRNRQQAKTVAEQITKKFRENPLRKIYITSHSGGAGILAWALEDCPEDVKVETILFLAPALSPQYDLSKALAHVTNKAYVFYSSLDPILGAGTKVLGTIDRVNSEAAGLSGFTAPQNADPRQYAKLVAMPYLDAYMQYSNIGDHIGPMARAFSQNILAPLLGGKPPLRAATQPATPLGS